MPREVAVLEGTDGGMAVLWDEEYHFRRLSAEGDVVVRDSVEYVVVRCRLVDGVIRTVLRKVER